jgi:hypothetical protein
VLKNKNQFYKLKTIILMQQMFKMGTVCLLAIWKSILTCITYVL